MAPTTRFLQPHRSRGDSPGCRPLPALATGAWGAATADNVPSLSAFHEDESDIFLKIRRKEKSSCSVNAEILGEFFLVFLKEYYQPCSYSKNHLPTVGASLFRQWLRPFPAASVCEPCLKSSREAARTAPRPADRQPSPLLPRHLSPSSALWLSSLPALLPSQARRQAAGRGQRGG